CPCPRSELRPCPYRAAGAVYGAGYEAASLEVMSTRYFLRPMIHQSCSKVHRHEIKSAEPKPAPSRWPPHGPESSCWAGRNGVAHGGGIIDTGNGGDRVSGPHRR